MIDLNWMILRDLNEEPWCICIGGCWWLCITACQDIFAAPLCGNTTPDHLLLDRSPNIGPLISCWKLDKFKNCWNKSFKTSKKLTLVYQKFSNLLISKPNLLISKRDLSGPRLGTLSNNRWSGGSVLESNSTFFSHWKRWLTFTSPYFPSFMKFNEAPV